MTKANEEKAAAHREFNEAIALKYKLGEYSIAFGREDEFICDRTVVSAIDEAVRTALEKAAQAMCKKCRVGMPVEFKVCFSGDEPTFYHIFTPGEPWADIFNIPPLALDDQLYDRCSAAAIRSIVLRADDVREG